jgi:hypothetical protein
MSDSYKRGFFRDAKVGMKEQLADAFTKALLRDDFIRFRKWMGMHVFVSELTISSSVQRPHRIVERLSCCKAMEPGATCSV